MSNPYEVPETQQSDAQVIGMFGRLTEYGLQRTGKQALGFYLAYLLLGFVLGMVFGFIAALIAKGIPSQSAMIAGSIAAVILCAALTIAIGAKKARLVSFPTLFLLLAAVLCALAAGALGGLIPVAFMTTMENRSQPPDDMA